MGAPDSRLRILITSVGSLVGQNLLDVIEFAPVGRRSRVFLMGTNSIAASPGNFRCDRCYRVPETSTPDFAPAMGGILEACRPDLILCGRDEDTEVMARLLEENPGLTGRLPHGSAESLALGHDKWKTWAFTQRHGLPFAATFRPGPSGGLAALHAFAAEHGYPLIAKPVRGFASRGVMFILNRDHAERVAALDGYVFQEYLGDAAVLDAYFQALAGPPPLFAHAPDTEVRSCHTIISARGEAMPPFVSRNVHQAGITMQFERVEHRELEESTLRYARAFHREGGYGPMTVQFRQDRNGGWKGQEMNLRTDGNTFARFLLGFDDLALIVNELFPALDFPPYRPGAGAENCTIGKAVSSYRIPQEGVRAMEGGAAWSRDATPAAGAT